MSGLRISRIFVSIIIILFNCIGCVTVEEKPVLEGQTKTTIQQGWGRKPDKVYYKPAKLKYGADELWEYEYPGGGDVARYYFKDDVLIKREQVSYGDL